MKTTISLIFGFFLLLSFASLAQNAPVVTVGSAMYAPVSPATTIPVTVKDFVDIGSFTLTLKYQVPYSSYLGVTSNPAFTGLNVNSSTPGTLVITWFGSGLTLPDQAHLLDLTFSYPYPTYYQYAVSWDISSDNTCKFKKYEGGSYITLNDSPKNQHYINGIITFGAPTVYAPTITNAQPGLIAVPIIVTHFTNIGSVTLSLLYDQTVLTFSSYTQNLALGGQMNVGSQPDPGGKRKVVIGWYNYSGVLLNDGSTLVTLYFQYTNATANYSALNWFDNGPSCLFTTGDADNLYDTPTSFFYQDGLVAGQLSPQTLLPKLSNASSGTPVPVPVKVNNFTNIRALSLSFKYDPAVLTLPAGAFTPNPIFGGGLTLTNHPSGTDGKRRIELSWSGSSPISLANGSDIVSMNFDYNSGNTALTWNTGGDSCDYKGAFSKSLWKNPVSAYYQDGMISHHLAPITKIESATATTPGQTVSTLVIVRDFSNIGSFTLTLNYDPGVISYVNTIPNSLLGGSFTASSDGQGQIIFVWNGSSKSLPDGSTLFNLYFTYHGGSSSFEWYYNSGSCEYGEGTKSINLYDEPKTAFYINGTVTPSIKALHLTALLEGLYNGSGTMRGASDGSGFHFPLGTADLIKISLHKASDYPVIGYQASDVTLNTSGVATVGIPEAIHGWYYIAISNRNSIETISADSVSFTGNTINYNFNSPAKAYGNNLGSTTDGSSVIYSGDSNQDQIVDGSDLSDISNLAQAAESGYIPEDLNGDGLVDGADLSIAGNNADASIGVITP